MAYTDISDRLSQQLEQAGDGETVTLPQGTCILSRKLTVRGKKGLTIRGDNTTLLSVFDPHEGFWQYSGIFAFEDCQDLVLENLTFNTTKPVNSTGWVIATDAAACTFMVDMPEDCALDGSQTIFGLNSIDADGAPEYTLATTDAAGDIPYELLDAHRAVIHCKPHMKEQIARLPIGMGMCMRHGIGNFKVLENSAITFRNCDDTVIRDVTVHGSAGYMMVVFPRCHNFTIERYRVEVPKDSHRLMASNIDAIHLLGLSGKLTVTDCYFDGLGDDALNIHSTAGIVNSIAGNAMEAINGRFSIPLETDWCRPGDTLAIYSKDFTYKGSCRVEKYQDSRITFTNLEGEMTPGDVLANTAYYAETVITGCEMRNTRARGLLLQTENITVRDCRFYGIALPAILLAPDIDVWYEVGPVKNCLIESCTFEKCACSQNGHIPGVIAVKVSHDGKPKDNRPMGVHRHITVRRNRFIDCSDAPAMFFESVDGLTVKDNEGVAPANVRLESCRDVTL